MDSAPNPFYLTKKPVKFNIEQKEKKNENEEYEIIEEKNFSLNENNEKFILVVSLTNKDSIIFKLKIDADVFSTYYETNYEINLLTSLEPIFQYFTKPKESFLFIIENI